MSDNYVNMTFDLDGFEKISDIIFLDQPILTHLIKNERDYFKYLVDTSKNFDLFLLIEIDKQDLIGYLLGEKSLYSVIVNNNYIGTIFKEDFKGLIFESYSVNPAKILNDYLPEEDSYLNIDFSCISYYKEIIDSYKKDIYIRGLRDTAFYLKFEPTDPKYQDTIGFIDLSSELLDNVVLSYKNFAQADFNGKFKERIGDQIKLNKTFKAVSPHIDLRVVDLAYGSFEIGISVDTVMKMEIEDRSLREWAIDIGNKYKEIILDFDIDDKDADSIISKYSDGDRRMIFNPLISIINNPNFIFKIKDNKKSNYKKYTIKKGIQMKIAPVNNKTDKLEKNLELATLTVVIDKNAKTKKIINTEKSLFTPIEAATVIITNKEFENNGILLDEIINIPVQIESHGNYIIFSADYKGVKFSERVSSDNLTYAINLLVNQIAIHHSLK